MSNASGDSASQANEAAVEALLQRAENVPTYAASLPYVAEALSLELLEAMKATKIPRAEEQIEALRRSGLDQLLVEAMLRGRLTYQAADRHLNRMRDGIRQRTVTIPDLKAGILAFDSAAQRLALAGGKTGPFQYSTRQNHARDSLITFARSLHR